MWYNFGSNYKGSRNGPFNDEEIDDLKERSEDSLNNYDDEYGWDGIERNWRYNLYELTELEEYRIEEFVNNYIRKYIIGNEEPDEYEKEELSSAIECYVEMVLFPEEHYDSKEEERYENPNANLIWMINQFSKKAMEVITNKEKIGDKFKSFKDLVSTQNKSSIPLYEGGDESKLVQIGNGDKLISIYKVKGNNKICIQEEQKDRAEQTIYELQDEEDYEQIESIRIGRETDHEQNAENLEKSVNKSKQLDDEITQVVNDKKDRG